MELFQYQLVILLIFLLTDFQPSFASISCSFDKDWCDWRNEDGAQFLWKSKAGQTDDRTSGPLNDHTCNNIMGQYIFITGHDIKIKDSIAVINSAAFSLDTSSNLTFWYSMNGVGIGKLLLSRLEGKKRENLWERTGRQGRGWMRGYVTLHPGKMMLQFSATAMLPYSSDTALDDIHLDSESTHVEKNHCKLTTTSTTTTLTTRMTTTSVPSTLIHTSRPAIPTVCPIATEHAVVLPGSCDFEKDLCGNKISSNMSAGRLWHIEWERTQKSQNYGAAKINGDHTKKQDIDSRGYYMNFKNGIGFDHGDTIAIIETPAINNHLSCLTFWYNMPSNYSNLKVLVKHEKLIREVWKREKVFSGKHLGWHRVALVISEQPPYSILFQTYNKEYQAYIGIDDILIIGANMSDPGTSSSSKSTTTAQRTVRFTNSMARTDTTVAQTQSSTSEELFSKLTTTDRSQTEITSRPSTMTASWSLLNNNQSTLSPIFTNKTELPELNFTKMTNSHTKNASALVSGPTTRISSSLSRFITRIFETSTLSSTIFKALSSEKTTISYTVQPATEQSTLTANESSPTMSSRMKVVTDLPETSNKMSSSTVSSASRKTLLSTTDLEQTSSVTVDSSMSPSPSSLSSLSAINNISQTQPTSTSKVTPFNTTASSLSSAAISSAKSTSTVLSKESKKTEFVTTTMKNTKAPKPTTVIKNKKNQSDKQKQNSAVDNDGDDLSSAAIAGIVVGSVCVIVVIGLMFYFLVLKSKENIKTVGAKALPANGKAYHTNSSLSSENGKIDCMNGNAHNMKKYMNGSVDDMKTEILMPSEINFKMINERTYSTHL